MRRAERLFELVELLRRWPLVRAADLAGILEVSVRTVYRDIADLAATGVPVRGEAGVGYTLDPGFYLPPLMLSEDEAEALVLGARIVESWADTGLAQAAGGLVAKLEAVVPPRLREHMAATALLAPSWHQAEPLAFDLGELRRALRHRRKVALAYRDGRGGATERVVRPLSLAFFGPVWLLAAWCELRGDFRSFRLDRVVTLTVRDETFKAEPGRTLKDFLGRHIDDR